MSLHHLDPENEPRECMICGGGGECWDGGDVTRASGMKRCKRCNGTGRLGDPDAQADVEVTDTPQSWAACSLCEESYREEPAGGLTLPDACEACGSALLAPEYGYWYSEVEDFHIFGPFPTPTAALEAAREAHRNG